MALYSNLFTVYVALQFFILSSFNFTSPAVGTGTSSGLGLLPPYDVLYYSGVRAYFNEEWEKAAELLEKSIATKAALFRTRRQCHDDCLTAGKDRLSKIGIKVERQAY